MAKQQRMGWWFLCLACVVVMVCTAQRMAGLHALQMQATASAAVVSAPSSTDDGSPVTPCELSAKSLLAAPPVLFEVAILALCL
ncbi:copper resistance protein, partial [Salmonella enterica]